VEVKLVWQISYPLQMVRAIKQKDPHRVSKIDLAAKGSILFSNGFEF
jgi:hypothetical protein